MTTLSLPHSFTNLTNADATKVQADFDSVVTHVNSELVNRDGSVAFTAVPTGPATDPTLANHLVRKQYVDNFIPAGVVVDYAGSTAPSGWVFCDGTTYDGTSATYSRLFAAIGLLYGGTGSNFQVPDYRGRVAVGKAAAGTFATLGAAGGAETHTLATGELPSHVHDLGSHVHTAVTGVTITDPGHIHQIQRNSNQLQAWSSGLVYMYGLQADTGSGISTTQTGYTGITASANTTISSAVGNTGSAGSGTAHNNLQPYRVTNKIIKL